MQLSEHVIKFGIRENNEQTPLNMTIGCDLKFDRYNQKQCKKQAESYELEY